MAKVTSPAGGQPYGIRRVCQVWGVPRSSFYAALAPAPESTLPAAPPARRGPKPAITDAALLAAEQASGWKIYDINVLGAWLVQTYKGTFDTEISKGGIDGLIKTLADRNKRLAAGGIKTGNRS